MSGYEKKPEKKQKNNPDAEFIQAEKIAKQIKNEKDVIKKIKENTEIVNSYLPSLIGKTRQLKEKVEALSSEKLTTESFLFIGDTLLLSSDNLIVAGILEDFNEIADQSYCPYANPLVNSETAGKLKRQKETTEENMKKIGEILIKGINYERTKPSPNIKLLEYLIKASQQLIKWMQAFLRFEINCSTKAEALEETIKDVEKFKEVKLAKNMGIKTPLLRAGGSSDSTISYSSTPSTFYSTNKLPPKQTATAVKEPDKTNSYNK